MKIEEINTRITFEEFIANYFEVHPIIYVQNEISTCTNT